MPRLEYERLWFNNGFAYRSCDIPLANQGLVLLRGVNLDDGGFLGAGKSSIFDIFAYLQTGRIGKAYRGDRQRVDDVVNRAVGRDFEAHLDLRIDGVPHRISQYRQHRENGNRYVFASVDQGLGESLVPHAQRIRPHYWVIKQLGFDLKTFFNSVYMHQDMTNLLLSGTDSERLQNMMELFNLDIFDRLLDLTDVKIKAQRAKLQDIEGVQEELRGVLAELSQSASLDVARSKMNEAVARQERLAAEHESTVQQLESLQTAIRGVETRNTYIDEIKTAWQASPLPVEHPGKVDPVLIESLRSDVEANETRAASLRASREGVKKRQIIEERLRRLGDAVSANVNEELSELRGRLSELQHIDLPAAEAREEARGDIARIPAETRQREVEYDALAAELNELIRNEGRLQGRIEEISNHLKAGFCPTCKRPYDDDLDDADSMRQTQAGARDELQRITLRRREVDTLVADLTRYRDAKERLANAGTSRGSSEVQAEISKLRSREKKLQAAQESEDLRRRLEAQLETLPAQSGDDLEAQISDAELSLQQSRDLLACANTIMDRLQRIRGLPRGEITDLKEKAAAMQRQLLNYSAQVSSASTAASEARRVYDRVAELTQRKEKIEAAIRRSQTIADQLSVMLALKQCFGARGLKYDRFRSILHDATRRTVPPFTQLFWPKQNVEIDIIEQKKSVKIGLNRTDGPQVESRLISGGERNKVGMSLLFGLRDLKEIYTGTSSNLLIMDEPSVHFDAHGINRLMAVLKRLRDRFSTIIVIGNQTDVLTSPEWDQEWWAVRQDNEARLYRTNPPDAAVEAARHMEF